MHQLEDGLVRYRSKGCSSKANGEIMFFSRHFQMLLTLFMHPHGGFMEGGAYEKLKELSSYGNPSFSLISMADTPPKLPVC